MDSAEFLDSNVIIYAFTNNSKKESCRKAIMERKLITNSLVMAESIGTISVIADKEQARSALIAILKCGNIQIISLSESLLFEAVRRSKKYNLKFFDLIHYTSALMNNCQKIISYDRDFDKLEIPRLEP